MAESKKQQKPQVDFEEAAKGTVLLGAKIVKRQSPRPSNLVPSRNFPGDKFTDFDLVLEYGPAPDEQKSK